MEGFAPPPVAAIEATELLIASIVVAVAGLNLLARRISVPYPIVLVIAGLGLGLIPEAPTIRLQPELVLLVFLPPLLYAAAAFADVRALRAELGAISALAIGLVVVTTLVVAVVGHEVLGLSWALAFALGAIVSPTDPVAAAAIMQRLGVDRSIVTVVEGESLINDATALVLYKTAIAAAVGAGFSVVDAGLEFVVDGLGGIAVGLVVGLVVNFARRRIEDPATMITISLVSGYAAYLPADELGASGVLAAVTAGLVVATRLSEYSSPEQRLQGFAVWEMVVFILNATLFVLIGSQLPVIVDAAVGESAIEELGYAALVCAVVIAVRFIWVLSVPAVRTLVRSDGRAGREGELASRVVIAWSGLRGAVSLAAALAIPVSTEAGEQLEGRSLVLFITFAVILVTILGQGLTLPPLIRRLGVRADPEAERSEEARARLEATTAAIEVLDELEGEEWAREETLERLRSVLAARRRRFASRAGELEEEGIEQRAADYRRVMEELYRVQRQTVIRLRDAGQISNEIMRRIERDLDLEQAREEL